MLADAVRVLTEAARLTRPVLTRDETAAPESGPAWVDSGKREQADWAEFVTAALAGAAANVGGIEAALNGRPGSWEADGVRNLLTSTVGHDEAYLLEHRTEPLAVRVFVDELMVDLGVWKTYDDAQREVTARYTALDIPDPFSADSAETGRTAEQDRQAADYDALEQQRERDWAEYGQALTANIEAAAAQLPGLRVPVVVDVDEVTFRTPENREGGTWGVAERVLDQAVQATPLPGAGRAPLDRLQP